jgi:thioredoxin reductase
LALELPQWSGHITLCTDGPARLNGDALGRLSRNGISVRTERILRLEGNSGQVQHSELPARLGCCFTAKGTVRPGNLQSTNIPGLYVAGDAARDVQFVVVAAAKGVRAAFAINTELLRQDLA